MLRYCALMSVLNSEQEYIETKDAVALTGFSRRTVQKWLAEYRNTNGLQGLRHYKCGYRTVKILRSDLDAFMASMNPVLDEL